MRKQRWTIAALLTLPVLVAVPARAQDTTQPVDPQQAVMQQVRQTFQTIVQNMIAKGIDPRQFFQQLQSGADPSDIAKQMVDQGLIDQRSLTDLQASVQKLTTGQIRGQLGATDDEWVVLDPMIRKVMTAQAVVQRARGGMGGGGMGGLMGGFMAVQTPTGADLTRATKTLRAALDAKNVSSEEVNVALATLRNVRSRAAAELVNAQKDLTSAVTVRQEAVLVRLGLLE
jgi:hypothetical protein